MIKDTNLFKLFNKQINNYYQDNFARKNNKIKDQIKLKQKMMKKTKYKLISKIKKNPIKQINLIYSMKNQIIVRKDNMNKLNLKKKKYKANNIRKIWIIKTFNKSQVNIKNHLNHKTSQNKFSKCNYL